MNLKCRSRRLFGEPRTRLSRPGGRVQADPAQMNRE
jgi:hypothetical protein